jgi:hypothetical protein
MSNIDKAKSSLSIGSPDDTLHLAQDVAKFIKEQRLYSNIQGKAYVNVEGWQYAGGRLGIVPIMEKVEKLSTEDKTESKYQAEVKLINLKDNQVVGYGFALCSNKEFGKKAFQEYAVASMAQTRAISKAYRNLLAWIIRAAGYEPTPYEEMEAVEAEVVESKTAVTKPSASEKQQEEAATEKQVAQIEKLIRSSVFSDEERSNMAHKLANGLRKSKASEWIDKIQNTISERKAAAKKPQPEPAA